MHADRAQVGHQQREGQLGNGTTTSSTATVVITGLSGVVEIAAGNDGVCARKNDGSVVCWGDNSGGRLGNGTTANSSTPVAVMGP